MRTTKMIFFFNDTATTEIYTLSLHDALPIYASHSPTFLGYRILDYEGSGAWLTCHRHHVNCPPIDISPADTSATGRIPTFHPDADDRIRRRRPACRRCRASTGSHRHPAPSQLQRGSAHRGTLPGG